MPNQDAIMILAAQRQAELRSHVTGHRRNPRYRRSPGRPILGWRLNWSRARLSGDQPSLVIIISASRVA